VEFTTKKSRNYSVLRLKIADMGRKVQETNAYDETENQNAKRKRIGSKLDEEGT
jgi:hypothetical protein